VSLDANRVERGDAQAERLETDVHQGDHGSWRLGRAKVP
jgi:hypothetical protein